jgi:hypothetical protein
VKFVTFLNPPVQVMHHFPPKRAWSRLAVTGYEMAPEMARADPGDKINRTYPNEKPSVQKMQAPPPVVLVENFAGPDRTDRRTRISEKGDTFPHPPC